MKGGRDSLRTAVGNYWYVSEGSEDEVSAPTTIEYNQLDLTDFDTAFEEEDLRGYAAYNLKIDPLHNDYIYKLEVNPTLMTKIDGSTFVPNFRIPVRLYANVENTRGDTFWQTYFSGGKFGEDLYSPLISSDQVFYDCSFNFTTYYSTKYQKASALEEVNIYDIRSNYFDYNRYLQTYQDWASGQPTERNLVNAYVMRDFVRYYQENIDESTDRWALTEALQDEMTTQKEALYRYYLPWEDWYMTVPLQRNQYYGDSFLYATKDPNMEAAVSRHQENIMFDQFYYIDFCTDGLGSSSELEMDASNKRVILPDVVDETDKERLTDMYNISITFPRHMAPSDLDILDTDPDAWAYPSFMESTGDIEYSPTVPCAAEFYLRDAIQDSNFSSKFLELLKDLEEGTITSVPYSTQNYAIEKEDSGSALTSTSEVSLRSFDWLRFLTYAYNEYDGALNDNYVYMGASRAEHKTTYVDNTLFRFSDNQNVLDTIDRSVDYLSDMFRTLTNQVDEQETRKVTDDSLSYGVSMDILQHIVNPQFKESGVIAYRIDKIAGEPSAGTTTPAPVQKFWMFNAREAPETLSLLDSQVKYGKNYTYNAYAYVSVMCYKYRYGDLRLTKQIGTVFDHDRNDFIDASPMTEKPDFYCLQFYDAETLELADQLFTISNTGTKDPTGLVYSSLAEFNTWATSQQDISEWPQLADYHLFVEPVIKIIEIPLFSKTLKVLDSPPNSMSAIPFQFIDQSHRIGFDIAAESYVDRPWPITITPEDAQLKVDYLHSRCMFETENITQWSESPARYIEIYKTTERPTSFANFNGKLRSTIDLRIEGDNEFNFSNYIAADKITPNKDYYYVLRLLNENRMPGPLSSIIIAQLVDDGGYIYSLFDTLDSSEFLPPIYDHNVKNFKKLIQLSPSARQTALDSSGIDFTSTASEQLENLVVGLSEDGIWGKRFKIRLTSKKTGKKLDLNVRYDLQYVDKTTISDTLTPPSLDDEEGEEI